MTTILSKAYDSTISGQVIFKTVHDQDKSDVLKHRRRLVVKLFEVFYIFTIDYTMFNKRIKGWPRMYWSKLQ